MKENTNNIDSVRNTEELKKNILESIERFKSNKNETFEETFSKFYLHTFSSLNTKNNISYTNMVIEIFNENTNKNIPLVQESDFDGSKGQLVKGEYWSNLKLIKVTTLEHYALHSDLICLVFENFLIQDPEELSYLIGRCEYLLDEDSSPVIGSHIEQFKNIVNDYSNLDREEESEIPIVKYLEDLAEVKVFNLSESSLGGVNSESTEGSNIEDLN